MRGYLLLSLLFFSCYGLLAQSYRGLAALNDSVCWVSGSKGTVVKTEDGGRHWDTISPKGFSTKEFRDIHVYSASHALIMSSGDSAVILRTRDGGESWQTVHSNNRPGVFYDAMDVFGPYIIVIGDPYTSEGSGNLIFDIHLSCDYGLTWECQELLQKEMQAESGEALFAASGSNIILDFGKAFGANIFRVRELRHSFVTGGSISRYNKFGLRIVLPFDTCSSCGAYSHARISDSVVVIVGGNYMKPHDREKTCVYFDTKTTTFQFSLTPPNGYRSCVAEFNNGQLWVCTGINGTDLSKDNGKTWKVLPIEGHNSCTFSENYLWLCGDKGRVKRVAVSTLD